MPGNTLEWSNFLVNLTIRFFVNTEDTIIKKRKKILGSYPIATVIFSITLSLTVIGLFGLILINAQSITTIINNQVGQVQIYMHNQISDSLSTAFKEELAHKPYIQKEADGIAKIDFVSKEDAKKEYIRQTGEDFTKIIEENPLHSCYTIYISKPNTDSLSMNFIIKELNDSPAVYEVIYEEALLQKVSRNIRNVGLVLGGFAILLTLVSGFLINNTIKLALYSQRFLIRSMQLVGAKPFFIQKPFIYRAILQGTLSGILADLILFGFQEYAFYYIEDLKKLYNPEQVIILYGILILTGAVIGFISSFRSVRKYIYMSLDDLY